MTIDNKSFCRVCGYNNLEPPWGDDGKSPTYDYCPCCGVEFGYQDACIEGIKSYRKKWLDIFTPINKTTIKTNIKNEKSNSC